MAKRLSDWKRQADRALQAMREAREQGHPCDWWDGRQWRPHTELPNKGDAYRTADDVLAEAVHAMVGDGPANGRARLRAANRFGQSSRALKGKVTERETESRRAWAVLITAYGLDRLRGPLGKDFLDECSDTLEGAGVPPPAGGDAELGWSSDRFRVRDLIRRHLKRLQPST